MLKPFVSDPDERAAVQSRDSGSLHWTTDLRVGDLVSYTDVNLWFSMRGRLVKLEHATHIAWVEWFNRPGWLADEWAPNLYAWR